VALGHARDGEGATSAIAAAEIDLARKHRAAAVTRLEVLLRDTTPRVADRFEAELVLARARPA
jgi:hypothetical protein